MTFTAPADPVVDAEAAESPDSARSPDRELLGKARSRGAPLLRTLGTARGSQGRLVVATMLGGGAIGSAIGLIASSAWLISRASQHPGVFALGLAIAGVRLFAIARGALRYGERLVGHDAALRSLADLRVSIYRKLERLAPAGITAFRSGDLLARLVHDVDGLQDLLLRVIPPFAVAGTIGAATVGLIWWLLPSAGVILLVTLVLGATAVPSFTRALARRSRAVQSEARGELSASVVDLLQGAPDLVACGAVARQVAKTAAADAELSRTEASTARTEGVGSGATTLLTGLAMWGALVAGISAVHSRSMHGVVLAVIALVPLAAFELVVGLPTATETFERVRRGAARVFAVQDASPPVREPTVAVGVPPSPHVVRISSLRARYDSTGPWALDGVDLELKPGRRVAIVGSSGAGKSTLAAVLLRFLAYEGGSATIDGIELADIESDHVRRIIGLAAQDAYVFDTTLERNMRLARTGASDEEIRSALEAARLLDWVEQLPDGLATEVGEHGARMSGGQRQRLSIARALLADFPVLVLDEPGAHLDTATADAITNEIIEVTRGRSTLLITHRLKGLVEMDEVMVMSAGRVIERGTHSELVAAGGEYARLWRREKEAEEVAL